MTLTIEKGEFKVGRAKYRYRVDDEPTRSVTEVLDRTTPKPWLAPWTQKVTCHALADLHDETGIVTDALEAGGQAVVDLLRKNKARADDQKEIAAERGSAVHDAAEQFAKFGAVPNPTDFPEEWRGYVRSLALFLIEWQPQFINTEIAVASKQYGFAGTYDARVRIGDRTGIIDYKTSKVIGEPYHIQLAAYELASIEMGYDPTDFQAVIQLHEDGAEATFEESVAKPGDFIAAVEWWKALEGVKQRRKDAR